MPRRKTNEEFLKEVYDLVGEEYTPLENYKLSATKILFEHNKCNEKFMARPSEFLKRAICPICSPYDPHAKRKINKQEEMA